MPRLSIALLIFSTLSAPAQQPIASSSPFPSKLFIPAQLTKTVQSNKAHPGDPVEFRTLEAVLVDKGLVMPVNTSL